MLASFIQFAFIKRKMEKKFDKLNGVMVLKSDDIQGEDKAMLVFNLLLYVYTQVVNSEQFSSARQILHQKMAFQ